jgi:hypothetical protein
MEKIGDTLTITLEACSDDGREVTVRGYVLTVDDALLLVEDALRGAGFAVPHESVQVVREEKR